MKWLRNLMQLVGGEKQLKEFGLMVLLVSCFYSVMSFLLVAISLLGVDKECYQFQPWDIVLQPAMAFIGVALTLFIIGLLAFTAVAMILAIARRWNRNRTH